MTHTIPGAQPTVSPPTAKAPSPVRAFEPLETLARESLAANLNQVQDKTYLSAGKHQFKSLWTRDFCWSVRGLIEAGHARVVRDQLTTLLARMRPEDGLIPRSLDTMNPVWRVVWASAACVLPFLPRERPLVGELKPEYRDQQGEIAIDGNILVLFAALEYVRMARDEKWWSDHEAQFVRVFRFYDQHLRDGLVHQPPYSDWQDSVRREGATFYVNLLYHEVARRLSDKTSFGVEAAAMGALRERIDATFFDQESGLFRAVAGQPFVSLDGNLLAIDLGFVAPESPRARDLYAALKASELWTRHGTPGFNTVPNYPKSWRNTGVRIGGLGHYHDEIQWSWLMAMAAKVSALMGDARAAGEIFDKLQRLAVRDGAIAEIFTADAEARPWTGFLYRSEQPFSWGAAIALEALATLKRMA